MPIAQDGAFSYRCVRAKRKKSSSGPASGMAAFQMSGLASSHGTDRRGLPLPSTQSLSATGGMLKGFLRRGPSQVQTTSSQRSVPSTQALDAHSFVPFTPTTPDGPSFPESSSNSLLAGSEPLYGGMSSKDKGGEVRFSVELTRIPGLQDTLSLDMRRLKGDLGSYKFLYDTLRDRCDLSR